MEEVSFCWKGISASAQVGPPFRKKKKVILDNGEESINQLHAVSFNWETVECFISISHIRTDIRTHGHTTCPHNFDIVPISLSQLKHTECTQL